MRVAIVGAGISGLVAAYLLQRKHDITVFEAADYVGGHTNTIDIDEGDRRVPVDTGFIVFNRHNYPNFCQLLQRLGVESQASDMSFSVREERTGFEYAGGSLRGLFAQRRNLFRPRFHRMVRDVLRFYREAPDQIDKLDPSVTLGDYLHDWRYSRDFVDRHIVPMGAAIWSSGTGGMLRFPARFFMRFFANHGMLQLRNRPRWRAIRGGSRQYVRVLTDGFRERIRTKTPIVGIRRGDTGVEVRPRGGEPEHFDKVVLACHSDQSLRMLDDPSDAERRVLAALPYQSNDTLLHTDARLMPHSPRAWASWNFNAENGSNERVTMTYYMNRLQNLKSRNDYCVTLNRSDRVDPNRVLRRMNYDHPVYTVDGIAARKERASISGQRNTFYCGAYWGYGFHEDGVNSALDVCAHFGEKL